MVVDVSSEKIYWIPITNDESLRVEAKKSVNNESIQVHLPIENSLVRKDDNSAKKMLDSVIECWDYLSLKGLKDSIDRYPAISPLSLNKRIEDIGDALFKAYHQQLNNLLFDKDFNEVFRKSAEICRSPIVPAKDRFVALLYYFHAFQISPFTNIKREIFEENFKVCHWLINLAREQKSRIHRLIAIGSSRRIKFKMQLDQLDAAHSSTNHLDKESLEHYIFNNQTQFFYRECCLSLQKIIELFNRLIRDGQYDVLSDIFIDSYASILVFRTINKSMGTNESITFLDNWNENIISLVMTYCVIASDIFKIKRLYYLALTLLKEQNTTKVLRKMILSRLPELEGMLNEFENRVIESSNHQDFYSSSIEDQKSYFVYMAKNLGMDPDDPESEFGHIVRMGLKNYDPSSIMRNCESLFVHYRPGGIIAQSLRMHSAGGMHLLVCLKHGHAKGTGNLLTLLYDDSDGPNLGYSFKQMICDKCPDCQPRSKDWSWNLKWYEAAVKENWDILNKYKF